MNVVVFDLDGTLLRTNAVDDECFAAACRLEFDIDCAGVDWSTFPHVTDAAIARELLERHGMIASSDHVRRIERRFIELLSRSADQNPERFSVVDGAREAVERLLIDGWKVVIATGAWQSSARLKLRAARCFTDVPLSTCEVGRSREDIVRHALARSGQHGRAVLVGDASWDVRTASNLDLPFIGIGERLKRWGATHVLHDFSVYEDFEVALREAHTPHPAFGHPLSASRGGGGI